MAEGYRPGMTIPTDTKDWTWVLDRACPECGFDPAGVTTDNLARRLQAAVAPWPELLDVGLGAHAVALRLVPSTWSRLEYAAHVLEVTQLMRHRLEQILAADGARFADWDQDQAAEDGDYGTQRPSEVAAGIAEDGAALVDAFAAVAADAWQRKGIRSNGSVFTAFTLGVYTLHDLEHHLWDVTDGVPSAGSAGSYASDAPHGPDGSTGSNESEKSQR